MFFTRLHQFVITSDAFVVAPGGIGTVLETMMIWHLLRVHHLRDTPLILVGRMWRGLVDWARGAMLSADAPRASPEDMSIPRYVDGGDEAIALIGEHRERWLRVGRAWPVPEATLAQLHRRAVEETNATTKLGA